MADENQLQLIERAIRNSASQGGGSAKDESQLIPYGAVNPYGGGAMGGALRFLSGFNRAGETPMAKDMKSASQERFKVDPFTGEMTQIQSPLNALLYAADPNYNKDFRIGKTRDEAEGLVKAHKGKMQLAEMLGSMGENFNPMQLMSNMINSGYMTKEEVFKLIPMLMLGKENMRNFLGEKPTESTGGAKKQEVVIEGSLGDDIAKAIKSVSPEAKDNRAPTKKQTPVKTKSGGIPPSPEKTVSSPQLEPYTPEQKRMVEIMKRRAEATARFNEFIKSMTYGEQPASGVAKDKDKKSMFTEGDFKLRLDDTGTSSPYKGSLSVPTELAPSKVYKKVMDFLYRAENRNANREHIIKARNDKSVYERHRKKEEEAFRNSSIVKFLYNIGFDFKEDFYK